MKIKIITCHDVNNYGASLQAYALQTFLQQHGHEVEVIDYLPYYKIDRLRFFEYNRTKGKIHSVVSLMPFLKPLIGLYDHLHNSKFRGDYRFYKKKNSFDLFKRNYINCTKKAYRKFLDLQKNPPVADLYIAGSDQIWNSVAQNGRDEAYYCAFIPKGSRCISYAASFGTSYIPEKLREFVALQLSRFSAISVRERSGVDIVKGLGMSATEVLDPVFLLDKTYWERLLKNRHAEDKYLLVYDLDMNHPGVKRLCQYLAKANNWKIYSLNDFCICPYADYNINSAGPIEFLEWIRDAQFIVCTSFHGSAFSVIFNKQFYTFPLYGQTNHARMENFLQKMGIADHYVKDIIREDSLTDIKYQEVNTLVVKNKEYSINWLLDNMKEVLCDE